MAKPIDFIRSQIIEAKNSYLDLARKEKDTYQKLFTSQGELPLEKDTFKQIVVPGDGSCLFHAVYLGMLQSPALKATMDRLKITTSQDLRVKTVTAVSLSENFKPFFTDSERKTYLEDMSKPTTFGGQTEIIAMCTLLNINLEIYDSISGKHSHGNCEDPSRTLCLRRKKYHYDFLFPKSNKQSIVVPEYLKNQSQKDHAEKLGQLFKSACETIRLLLADVTDANLSEKELQVLRVLSTFEAIKPDPISFGTKKYDEEKQEEPKKTPPESSYPSFYKKAAKTRLW